MLMMGKLSHVFTKIVFVPLKHGVAIDHIYQEITLRRLSIESDLLKVSLSLASLALPAPSPQKENFLSTLVDKKYKTVTRVLKYNLSTNIYGTFASHGS